MEMASVMNPPYRHACFACIERELKPAVSLYDPTGHPVLYHPGSFACIESELKRILYHKGTLPAFNFQFLNSPVLSRGDWTGLAKAYLANSAASTRTFNLAQIYVPPACRKGRPGQPVVQTLARFGEHASCVDLTADRAGNIYAAAVRESPGRPAHVLQIKPGTNELVQLPVRLAEDACSMAVSPSGQELSCVNDGLCNGVTLIVGPRVV
jgi:hypothetical protein